MRHWTLGAKLTAWSTLMVGFVLLICGIGAGLYIENEQIEALDDQLRNEAHTFFGEVARQRGQLDWNRRSRVDAILPLTRTKRYAAIESTDGRSLYRPKRAVHPNLAGLSPGMHTIKIGKETHRLGVFPAEGVTLYLGAELNEINTDSKALLVGFLVGLPLLVGTIAFGGWWLARQALAPVREITIAAEQITADRLDRRLPTPRVRDEIGRLIDVLNAMFDRLDASFRQATRFSADASHELKTPLTVLRAGIEDLLESPSLLPNDQAAVSALLEQTRRLSSITESLLLLARADAGRLQLDFAPGDVAEIVTACAEDARIMAEPSAITIETDVPATLVASIDARRLGQIVLNLLDNAVKYNRQGGLVRVKVEGTGRNAVITIANTGAGIPEAHAPQLFKRFFRSDAHPDTPGHGLGLSIARELARAHHGDLQLVQSDSEWTVFAVSIMANTKTTPLVPVEAH
jgi:signal transduction histidine kinase